MSRSELPNNSFKSMYHKLALLFSQCKCQKQINPSLLCKSQKEGRATGYSFAAEIISLR